VEFFRWQRILKKANAVLKKIVERQQENREIINCERIPLYYGRAWKHG